MLSSKPPPPASRRFFMNEAMALLLWPSCAMEKVPSLLSFMTAGMEGKMQQASSWSRTGLTASTIWGARSREGDGEVRGCGCVASPG
jgi:hypothetical protein